MSSQNTVNVFQDAPEAIDAAVDYFTAYWSPEDSGRFPEQQVIEAINGTIRAGTRERRTTSRGIAWWGVPGFELGRRDGELYLRAAGIPARQHAEAALVSCSHLSRIDCAVTARFESAQDHAGRAAYVAFRELPPAFGQPRKCQLIEGSDDGATFSVGSRYSTTYLRLYDWGVAHNADDAGCSWRFEAEYKGARAEKVRAALLSSNLRQAAIEGLVYASFSDRRINPPWSAQAIRTVIEARPRTTLERRLAWFRSQVAPSVQESIGAGYIEAVVTALGLSEHVTINPPK